MMDDCPAIAMITASSFRSPKILTRRPTPPSSVIPVGLLFTHSMSFTGVASTLSHLYTRKVLFFGAQEQPIKRPTESSATWNERPANGSDRSRIWLPVKRLKILYFEGLVRETVTRLSPLTAMATSLLAVKPRSV